MICTKCNEDKELREYYFRKEYNNYRSYCKSCKKIQDNAYREQNQEKITKQMKEYQENNRESIVKNKREYYLKNREHLMKKAKQYYLKYRENPDWVEKERIKNRIKARSSEILKRKNEYNKRRKEYDLDYKLRRNISRNFRMRLNRGNHEGSKFLIDLLGCSFKQFKGYIAGQFDEGMSWDNYGHDTWHLDHIVPLSHFDLRDYTQQKIAFNYRNIQPMYAHHNMTKHCKVTIDQFKQVGLI